MLLFYNYLGLRGVQRELLKSLQVCKTSECKQVQKDYEIARLGENGIDYDQVIEMIYKHTAVEMLFYDNHEA